MELKEILNKVLIGEIRLHYHANNFELIKGILEQGVDINYQDQFGDCALLNAIETKNIDLVKLILSYNPNPNIKNLRGATPLIRAVRTGKLEIVKLLIKHKADINIQDNTGKTALMHVFKCTTNTDLVINRILILHKKIDLSIKSNDGKTFIEYAHTKNKSVLREIEIQKYILEKDPLLYLSFVNNQIKVNAKLKREYGHLAVVDKLGLL